MGDGISIGVNGIVVNGKAASKIHNLDDLQDTGHILGSGSFGVVKKVKHKATHEIFALKVNSF